MKLSINHFVITIFVLSVFHTGSLAQDVETLVCSQCQYENTLEDKFCAYCGDSLSDEYSQWQIIKNERKHDSRRFVLERVDPPRLFTVPVGQVLGSLDIRLVGGGAFGVATDKSFQGTVGIGLGDIAEVEFSTVGMISNITRGASAFPTSAFKLLLIPENKWHIPTLAVAIRSSSNWQDMQSEAKVLAAEVSFYDNRISRIGYDTRFTTMYGISTIKLWALRIHAGLTFTDVRVKELAVGYYYNDEFYDPVEKQRNLIGGFAGFDIESNPRTKLMLEVTTVSNYQYNVDTQRIDVTQAFRGIGGVRFFFNSWFSTDVGVWYQSSFRGIADMQIKIGLNLFIPSETFGRVTNFTRDRL